MSTDSTPAVRLHSRDDFQRCDLVAVEAEEEPQVDGAAGEVAGKPAGDDDHPVLLLAREWLARVLVLGGGVRLALPDRGLAEIGLPLVLYDGGFREAPGTGIGTFLVGGEVGDDGFWQIESHGSSLQVRHTGAIAPHASWTPTGTGRDNSALS